MTTLSLQAENKTLRVEPFNHCLLLAFRDDCGSLALSSAESFARSLQHNLPGLFKDTSTKGASASVELRPRADGCELLLETFGHRRTLHLSAHDRSTMADVICLLIGVPSNQTLLGAQN